MACYLHCLFSLLSFPSYGNIWYCVVCFFAVDHLYCFQLEPCFFVHYWCMFCFYCICFSNVLKCLLQDIPFCVCLTDLKGIVQLWSMLSLHVYCSWWLVILPLLCIFLWFIAVVMVSISSCCTVGPQFIIFSLNCYSRPYWNKPIISRSIMVLIFLFVFQLMFHNVNHHYLA